MKWLIVEVIFYGRVVSMSFFLLKEVIFIRGNFGKREVRWIVVKFFLFENIYFSGIFQREFEGVVRGRLSVNVFLLSFVLIFEEFDKVIFELSLNVVERLFIIYQEFFMCFEEDCIEYVMERVSNLIIEFRRSGKYLIQIVEYFRKVYGLIVYLGDVFMWFDGIVRKFEVIERIVRVFCVRKIEEGVKILKREIEEGRMIC